MSKGAITLVLSLFLGLDHQLTREGMFNHGGGEHFVITIITVLHQEKCQLSLAFSCAWLGDRQMFIGRGASKLLSLRMFENGAS